MQVETYEVELVDQDEMQQLATDGETSMLIESLGLEGQKSLTNKEKGTVTPYRVVSAEERFVFRTLFPNQTKVESYKDGPLPLRVLQVIAHVRELNIPDMGYFEVWHPNVGIDDPVLVARKSSYYDPVYLLARWGNALLPFETLKAQALVVAKKTYAIGIRKAQKELATALESIDDVIEEQLSKGQINIPYVNL